MAPQLYLITPPEADPDTFPALLMAVLSAAPFSALLVRRGSADAPTYARLAAAVVQVGQGAGCAVLVEDDAALARRIGADGVHVTTGIDELKLAAAALKPDLIVGAGGLATRDDAMTAGELNADYLFFGPLDGSSDAEAAELAQWWAETFEIPAVLSDPAASAAAVDDRGAEFLALSTSLWSDPAPAQFTAAIAAALSVTA